MTAQTQTQKLILSELMAELRDFHGTEAYHRRWPGLSLTDGVVHLERKANCAWLITLVASYQPEWKSKAQFQLWRINVDSDNTAVVTMREDSTEPILVQQDLTYTDFPEGVFEWYCVDGVMLLKNEY